MKKTIGFIGCGNMGAAIISGMAKTDITLHAELIIHDRNQEKMQKLIEKYPVKIIPALQEVVEKSDYLFLAVKPDSFEKTLEAIAPFLKISTIVISVAAGISIRTIEQKLGKDKKIVRAMPNAPALVNAAMTSFSANANLSEKMLTEVKLFLSSFGAVENVDESLIHAVVGVSGSSPAYTFMFIEAMADAAVMQGMSREQAYKFAAQSVLGAAKMVLETGVHPGALKDMVCSPGGTTIEAVAVLEKAGLRHSVIKAVNASAKKSRRLTKSH